VPECFPFPSMSMLEYFNFCLYPTNPTLFDAVRPSPGWLVTDLYQDPDFTKDLRLPYLFGSFLASTPAGPISGLQSRSRSMSWPCSCSRSVSPIFTLPTFRFPNETGSLSPTICIFLRVQKVESVSSINTSWLALKCAPFSEELYAASSRRLGILEPLLWKDKSGSLVLRERDQSTNSNIHYYFYSSVTLSLGGL